MSTSYLTYCERLGRCEVIHWRAVPEIPKVDSRRVKRIQWSICLSTLIMVFLNDPFLVLYYSSYILLLWVKSYPIHLQVINSMLMTLNSVSHSRLLTFHTILLILNKLYLMSKIWCHLTFFPLNPSKTEFRVIGLPKQLEKRNPLKHMLEHSQSS